MDILGLIFADYTDNCDSVHIDGGRAKSIYCRFNSLIEKETFI